MINFVNKSLLEVVIVSGLHVPMILGLATAKMGTLVSHELYIYVTKHSI